MSLKCILQGQDISKVSLDAHIADKNNPHNVTAKQAKAMPIIPIEITKNDNVLALIPGRYRYEGNDPEQTTTMNLPSIAWHWEIIVIADREIVESSNGYKVIIAVNQAGQVFKNILQWETWTGWQEIVTTNNIGNFSLPLHGWQAATDFNNLTASGIYQCQGVNLNTPYGSDADTHFHIQVYWHSNEWIRQVAYDVRTQNCYTRVKTNGTWSAWQQIILDSDIYSKNVNGANYAVIRDPATSSLKNIQASTTDLIAGSSALVTGNIYLVYE